MLYVHFGVRGKVAGGTILVAKPWPERSVVGGISLRQSHVTPIQYIVSSAAILAGIAHVPYPGLSIDAVTVGLLVLAAVPWLGQVFRSIEVPGFGKVEYHDLQRAERQAEQVGLLAPERPRKRYFFELVADSDPNLALAALRLEIEQRLRAIAKRNRVSSDSPGVLSLLAALQRRKVLSA